MSAVAIGGAALNVLRSVAVAGHGARRRGRSGSLHRTGAKVRRDSLEEGTFENEFFSIPAPGEADRMLAAARKLLDAGRRLRREEREGRVLDAAERGIAALTAGAIRVYEEICTIARLCAGKVYPSYDRLAEKTQLGRRTCVRGVRLLEGAGLLIRQRRFKRVEDEDGSARYEQTSNAYRPTLVQKLLSHLPRFMRPAPPPEDAIQRENDRREETEIMLAGLNCRERARMEVQSGPFADVLARLGGLIDARERVPQGA